MEKLHSRLNLVKFPEIIRLRRDTVEVRHNKPACISPQTLSSAATYDSASQTAESVAKHANENFGESLKLELSLEIVHLSMICVA